MSSKQSNNPHHTPNIAYQTNSKPPVPRKVSSPSQVGSKPSNPRSPQSKSTEGAITCRKIEQSSIKVNPICTNPPEPTEALTSEGRRRRSKLVKSATRGKKSGSLGRKLSKSSKRKQKQLNEMPLSKQAAASDGFISMNEEKARSSPRDGHLSLGRKSQSRSKKRSGKRRSSKSQKRGKEKNKFGIQQFRKQSNLVKSNQVSPIQETEHEDTLIQDMDDNQENTSINVQMTQSMGTLPVKYSTPNLPVKLEGVKSTTGQGKNRRLFPQRQSCSKQTLISIQTQVEDPEKLARRKEIVNGLTKKIYESTLKKMKKEMSQTALKKVGSIGQSQTLGVTKNTGNLLKPPMKKQFIRKRPAQNKAFQANERGLRQELGPRRSETRTKRSRAQGYNMTQSGVSGISPDDPKPHGQDPHIRSIEMMQEELVRKKRQVKKVKQETKQKKETGIINEFDRSLKREKSHPDLVRQQKRKWKQQKKQEQILEELRQKIRNEQLMQLNQNYKNKINKHKARSKSKNRSPKSHTLQGKRFKKRNKHSLISQASLTGEQRPPSQHTASLRSEGRKEVTIEHLKQKEIAGIELVNMGKRDSPRQGLKQRRGSSERRVKKRRRSQSKSRKKGKGKQMDPDDRSSIESMLSSLRGSKKLSKSTKSIKSSKSSMSSKRLAMDMPQQVRQVDHKQSLPGLPLPPQSMLPPPAPTRVFPKPVPRQVQKPVPKPVVQPKEEPLQSPPKSKVSSPPPRQKPFTPPCEAPKPPSSYPVEPPEPKEATPPRLPSPIEAPVQAISTSPLLEQHDISLTLSQPKSPAIELPKPTPVKIPSPVSSADDPQSPETATLEHDLVLITEKYGIQSSEKKRLSPSPNPMVIVEKTPSPFAKPTPQEVMSARRGGIGVDLSSTSSKIADLIDNHEEDKVSEQIPSPDTEPKIQSPDPVQDRQEVSPLQVTSEKKSSRASSSGKKRKSKSSPNSRDILQCVEEMTNALGDRKKVEEEIITNLYSKRKINKNSYKKRKVALEKWVNKEKREIKKASKLLVQGWMKAYDIIDTLDNEKDKMRKLIGQKQISGAHSTYSNFSDSFADNSYNIGHNSSFTPVPIKLQAVDRSNQNGPTSSNRNNSAKLDYLIKGYAKPRQRPNHSYEQYGNNTFKSSESSLDNLRSKPHNNSLSARIEDSRRTHHRAPLPIFHQNKDHPRVKFKKSKPPPKPTKDISDLTNSAHISVGSGSNSMIDDKQPYIKELFEKSGGKQEDRVDEGIADKEPEQPTSAVLFDEEWSYDKVQQLPQEQLCSHSSSPTTEEGLIFSPHAPEPMQAPDVSGEVGMQDELEKKPCDSDTDDSAEASPVLTVSDKSMLSPSSGSSTKVSSRVKESYIEFDNQAKSEVIADEILMTMLDELSQHPLVDPKNLMSEDSDEMPSFLTRGIDTTHTVVKQYLDELFEKINGSIPTFMEGLATPLQRDPLEILGHLQNIDIDSSSNDSIPFQQSVLHVDLYLKIEKDRRIRSMPDKEREEALKKEADREKRRLKKIEEIKFLTGDPDAVIPDDESEEDSIMAEWENIHNKVIFDSVNELLDNYRPYGLKGPPLAWSNQVRPLTYKYSEEDKVPDILNQVETKVVNWSKTNAGALSNTQIKPSDITTQLLFDRPGDDKEYLNQLREERLAMVLASEIDESEQLWLDYEYEETQVKLDIADMVLEDVVFEIIGQLNDGELPKHE